MADYPHGMPAWVELSTDDGETAERFYTELFGWDAVVTGPLEQTGGYRIFTQDGKAVAGLMAQEGLPTLWATYFSVDDADIAGAQIGEAGGTTLVGPLDVMDLGRMGFFADPAGAMFGVWEARGFGGAELEPNAIGGHCWSELATDDEEEAKRFYARVFGWSAAPYTGGIDYTLWMRGEESAGGMTSLGSDLAAPGATARWDAIFAVADTDDFAGRAAALGAVITMEPTDIPPGRYAALTDPLGGSFQVIKLAPMEGRGDLTTLE